MKPERWAKIDEVFHAALEREPDRRPEFINQACAGDKTLLKEVESLISSHEQAEIFIESPAADLAAAMLASGQGKREGWTPGPYRILQLLGVGGMGEVYLAEDTRLGRQVAIKLLPAEAVQDAERLSRFEREARAASALNHPNIITIHEIGQADGAHFIVTEFVEGRTLREQMSSARMKLDEALDVAVQAASALEAAHKAGIVHRDIKPENMMLRGDGLIKVLDFGLAKLTETQPAGAEVATPARLQTRSGVVMGTVTYMSPEQARGLAVDSRTDIFSLGTVIYEMIAGRVPFEGETTSDVIVSILEREPPPLSRYAPDAPPELERIVKKALAKKRDDRYQVVRDLLIDLKSLKEELTLQAKLGSDSRASRDTALQSSVETGDVLATPTATSSAEYLVQQIKNHKRAVALGVVLLVIAAITALLFLSTNKPRPTASAAAVKTIAVLPFKPLVASNRDETLELGMADTLINKLSGIKQLVVWPLSDVRKYRGLEQNAVAAGRELGVDYVLDGTLHMAGEEARVTWSVLNVKDASTVWADKCDKQCSSVFQLQDGITEQITTVLALKLTEEEKVQVAKHYTDSPEAFQLYSLGVSEQDMNKRVKYFERALKIDPNYALAYEEICRAYFAPGTRGFYISNEQRSKLEWAAMKAAQIDDTLPQVHFQLAKIRQYYWDWAAADQEFKWALELDPNSFENNFGYCSFLVDIGRLDEALVYAKRADEVNPRNSDHLPRIEALVYYHMRQYDKAIELWLQGRKSNKLAGGYDYRMSGGYQLLAEAYLAKAMYEQAVAEMEKVMTINKEPQRWDGYPILAFAYAKAGRRDEALKILNEQNRLAKQEHITPYNFVIIYTGLGDKDRAFEYLEKAFKEHAAPLYHFPSRPMFDSLHSDPRYADLVRRMNLPQFAG